MMPVSHLPKPLQIEVAPWFWSLGGLVQYTLAHDERWREITRNELRALLRLHSAPFRVERANGEGVRHTVLVGQHEDSRFPLHTAEICDFLAAHARMHTLDKAGNTLERAPTVFELVHAQRLRPEHTISIKREGEVLTKLAYLNEWNDRYRTLWRGPIFQRVSERDFSVDYDAPLDVACDSEARSND